ncbi:hypothetical protein ACN267_25945 [Micromonospora sp. WMMD734]|uniref:Uncharacterized protein n=1 Tax=Micromonospora humidisoli TaxID=2807622 RepID=A0ABS2JJF2_9ACTN|nr:hypothetical protein [Micromonospora humidisoli]MBM7086646.1 hypothetical protein [Micromonospora humidisoli]
MARFWELVLRAWALVLVLLVLSWIWGVSRRVVRSVRATLGLLRETAQALTETARAVEEYQRGMQEDRLLGQARRIGFELTGLFEGNADTGQPGAVVVRAENLSVDYIYNVEVRYAPAEGEAQSSRGIQLAPQIRQEWTFEISPTGPGPLLSELTLTFSDLRGLRWTRSAAGYTPLLVEPTEDKDSD